MAVRSDRAPAWTSEFEENDMTVVSGTTPQTTSSSSSASSAASANALANTQIAGNFQSFLELLTTQLQNQNPLSPLDTNQFTQQLVEFAGVQQQINTNDSLATLVSLQQTAQSSQALEFVGKTAVVKGNTAALTNSVAEWEFNIPSASTINISIANSTASAPMAPRSPMAITRSRRPPRIPPATRLGSPPRWRAWSVRSISPSRRRYCRSAARPSRSTRSKASSTRAQTAFQP